jgi:hypothetical protein
MTNALKYHWPEYLMEGACLDLFMISAYARRRQRSRPDHSRRSL